MAQYRPGQLAELLGVSPDTVRRWCDEGRLATVRTEGGHRLVEGVELARFVREDDGAYSPEQLHLQSARNRFNGVVTRVEHDKLHGRHRAPSRTVPDRVVAHPGGRRRPRARGG